MPDKIRRVYCDANVFEYYVDGDPNRAPIVHSLLVQANMVSPQIELVTSVFSITEVAYTEFERIGRQPTPEEEEKIANLWHPSTSPVKLLESFRFLHEQAARLMRTLALPQGWRLTASDALHLASAKYLEADEIYTYDEKLYKFAEGLGIPIVPPMTDLPMMVPTPQLPKGWEIPSIPSGLGLDLAEPSGETRDTPPEAAQRGAPET